MNESSAWSVTVTEGLAQTAQQLGDFLPKLLGAVALVLIGWLLATVLRALTRRLIRALARLTDSLTTRATVRAGRLVHTSELVVGNLLFWIVLLFFAAAATQLLGLVSLALWANQLLTYIPVLLAGAIIIVTGLIVGALTRDVIIATAPAAHPQRGLLARAAQIAVVVTAVVVGADQIGIEVGFLVIIAAVALGAFLGGLALSMSLGAQTHVSNLIGAHHARQTYQVGQRIRIAEHEGRVLELTPTAVILDSEEGRISLPARLFSEQAAVVRDDSEDA